MQVPAPNTGAASQSPAVSPQSVAQTDQSFADMLDGEGDSSDPASILTDITKNGISSLWGWQVDQMEQDVAGEVMQADGYTAQQIAAMPDQQRVQVEDKIMQEVEQRVKQMIEQDMEKKQKTVVDIDGAGAASADVGSVLSISA